MSRPDRYKIEIRRECTNPAEAISHVNTNWFQWYEKNYKEDVPASKTSNVVQRTAGFFEVRASMPIPNTSERLYSNTVKLEVQFPKVEDFKDHKDLMQDFNAMWNNTQIDAKTNQPMWREWGCFVTLNTAGNGTYGIVPVNPGNWSNSIYGIASISMSPCPGDNPKDYPPEFGVPVSAIAYQNPPGSATYVVATFHTHPPSTYRTPKGVPITDLGSSSPDDTNAHFYQLPGIVFDYIAPLVFGHPLNAPAKRYPYGPPSRKTP
jgi:hypothetical protein